MLSKKEKRYLKGLASTLTTKYQIGKDEITDNVIDLLDKALTAKELVKVDLLKTVETDTDAVALELVNKLNAELVQVIGRVIVLYRKNNKKKIIEFNF